VRGAGLVFDVGGTFVRGAPCDADTGRMGEARVGSTPSFLTRPGLGADALIDAVVEEMARVGALAAEGMAPAWIVVGWPGPIGTDGAALRSPTILGPQKDGRFDIRPRLSRAFATDRLEVVNDLTCAGALYVRRGLADFCIVTIGSGIGHKVFAGGRPLVGPSGRGGEMGHIAVAHPLPEPGGQQGPPAWLGEVSSGRGTLALARRLAAGWRGGASSLAAAGPDFSSEDLAAAFRSGDGLARAAVEAAARPLAATLAAAHALVGTERFIVTGGFAVALGEDYRRLLAAGAAGATWDLGQDWDAMIALGGRLDGLEGAAAYALTAPCTRGGRG
jgi:glucokinase